MQVSLIKNLDTFDAAVRLFFQTLKRPQTWQYITAKAGVDIDRPAATILLLLTVKDSQVSHLREIAEHLNIEAPSVTRKVQQLELAGLVERQQDLRDKRAYSLKATKRGHDVAQKIRGTQRQIVSQVLDRWTPEERTAFVGLFERFTQESAEAYGMKPLKYNS